MADIKKLCEILEKNGFHSRYFENGELATTYLCQNIQNCTVGIGGSTTVAQMGLYERLAENNEVFWHWKNKGDETIRQAANADIYICSANAVSETGEIVNIDGVGNRLAASIYGHKKVYIIVGINKIEPDLDKAIHRARNVAAPLNAKRLGVSTPCTVAEEMRCYNCSSPQRVCKGLQVLWQKMNGIGECEVILVGEELGF